MKKTSAWMLAGMLLVVVTGMAIVGCDTTQTTDTVITITPASVTMTNDWGTAVFTASLTSSNATLALPLVWSVSDSARGTIRASGGLTAIYEGKNIGGNNTITVRDQGENEGIAVVVGKLEDQQRGKSGSGGNSVVVSEWAMVGSESTQSTDNVISISPANVTVQLQYESDVAVGVVGE